MENPNGLQVLVSVLAAVLVLTWLARRMKVAPPIVLLLGGVLLAFLPWMGGVLLSPGVVLLLFLPALLFPEALTTSLREIRANLRMVLLSSTLLVLASAAAVATVGRALGLSWPVAWVLGAVVAPTDATALATLAGQMPRRMLTSLRAESVINDGTALVLFAVAVAVATGAQAFSWGNALGSFTISYLGGTVVGLLVACLAFWARRRSHERLPENGIYVVTPFVAFLLAEQIHASGVLAVLVCGLALSHVGPHLGCGRSRLQTDGFWQLTTFLLNGALFVLVGLQLPDALHDLALSSYSLGQGLRDTLLVSAAVIGTRLVWFNTVPYLIRAVDRRPQQRARRMGARQRVPLALAGFRGGVTLAAALAVPTTMDNGLPFRGRGLIVIVAFGVILVTLLVQGLTLPAVLRWAQLPDDGAEAREQRLAEHTTAAAGLAALPPTAARLGVPPAVADRVHADHEEHMHTVADPGTAGHDAAAAGPNAQHRHHDHRLRRALLPHQRAAIIRLRNSGTIDNVAVQRELARLDAEELRLSPSSTPEAEWEAPRRAFSWRVAGDRPGRRSRQWRQRVHSAFGHNFWPRKGG
jgi:CPA1 family monovalent cation:H+ antiporter